MHASRVNNIFSVNECYLEAVVVCDRCRLFKPLPAPLLKFNSTVAGISQIVADMHLQNNLIRCVYLQFYMTNSHSYKLLMKLLNRHISIKLYDSDCSSFHIIVTLKNTTEIDLKSHS